ncbi:AIPR family protein [Rossellomorea sp. NS-SX7]|uniref:AIPR family protein n=1 Tax=Rossellomorea sp. NS-SX7 TaxID=3463856 RepID=UPI0040585C4C
MPTILKRFEEDEENFILRVRTDQITTMFDPHDLRQFLSNHNHMPDINNWPHTLIYSAFIHVMDLGLGDDVTIPMKKNPREQNIKTTPSRRIAQSLKNTDIVEDGRPHNQAFYLLNRGIVLVAHKVVVLSNVIFEDETQLNPEVLEVTMDKEHEGNIDGGHTYKIIKNTVMDYRKNEELLDAFVRFEITVNFTDVSRLAEARNTSAQVLTRSIVNLQGGFDILKDLLSNLPFADRIMYKQFEKTEDGSKMLPVENIIRLLDLFNLERTPKYSTKSKYSRKPSVPPMKWASGADPIIKAYILEMENAAEEERDSEYVKMAAIIPGLFTIYTFSEKNIPDIYNRVGALDSTSTGNYANIGFSKSDKKFMYKNFRNITTYSDGQKNTLNGMKYDVPAGLVHPIIGSFRMLVTKDDDGYYKWLEGFDPTNQKEVEEMIEPLVSYLVTKARNENVDKVAKSNEHWNYCLLTMDQVRQSIEERGKVNNE